MNTQNRKMKIKRSNEMRNVEEFTKDEIDEIKNITVEQVLNTEFDAHLFSNQLTKDAKEEETSA
jgi:hypothetical protein